MANKTSSPWGIQGQMDRGKRDFSSLANANEETTKPALLLHSCCGPCSTSVIERLAPNYDITVFFYNPCITDVEEYERRKATQIKYIEEFNLKSGDARQITFLEGNYNPEAFYRLTSGYEAEPEGGDRCTICFRQRLEETAAKAKSIGIHGFTTTLSVSPHKNYLLISQIGQNLAEKYELEFLDLDFKKQAGFQRSIQLSKDHNLYRQNYCGCQYSKGEKNDKTIYSQGLQISD
ncbi:putative adenine nucleotide alpha hydrolase (AANH) superfamily ATPase [Clostridiales Family XIII bacterium PM5-7]